MNNSKLHDLYYEFHTDRRLQIESDVETLYNDWVKDGWSASPQTKKEVFWIIMDKQPSECDQMIAFAKKAIEDYIKESQNE